MPGMLQTGGSIDERLRDEIVRGVVTGKLRIRDACARYQVSQESIVGWVAALRRSSLLTFDAHLRQILEHQGIDASPIAAAEFTGNLGEITLAARGEISDAQSGKLVGVPAVHRLFALERGSVVETLTAVKRPRSVHISTTALLLDGVRRSDEYSAARSRLGPGLYQLSREASSARLSLSEKEIEALRHFDVPSRISDARERSSPALSTSVVPSGKAEALHERPSLLIIEQRLPKVQIVE